MIKIHRCSRETDSEKADVLKEDLKKEKTVSLFCEHVMLTSQILEPRK